VSKRGSLESLLDRAKNREEKYRWLESVVLYEKALGMVKRTDFYGKGKLQEKIGSCLHRAAFQAEIPTEFEQRMQLAIEAYEKSKRFYDKLTDNQKTARIFSCDAITKYLSSWITSNPPEKRRLLDECLELEGKALKAFSKSGEMQEYGRIYGALPHVFWLRARLEWSGQAIERIYRRGVEWGETAVAALATGEACAELAQVYYTLATCLWRMNTFIAEPEEQGQNRSTVVEYLRKAVDLAERTGNTRFVGLLTVALAGSTGLEEGRKKAEEALRYGEKTRDTFLIAWSLSQLAVWASAIAFAEEDPAKWKELMDEAFQFYERSHRLYSSMPIPSQFYGFMNFPHGWLCYYLEMADREVTHEQRLGFLTKAEAAGIEALRVAESSDSPEYAQTTLAYFSAVQRARAIIDVDLTEKRRRLETALKWKERSCQIREETMPFSYQTRGVGLTTLAMTKMYLADTESDPKVRQRLLEEASSNMEDGLTLCDKAMPLHEKLDALHIFAVYHRDQDFYALLLTRLYHVTGKPEHLRRAIAISRKAIDSAGKFDMVSRMAESYWKIAKAQDLLGDHLDAVASFQHASESYRKAAEKIPQLKGFYQDHATYMQAWSELEKARHHHAQGEYGHASEQYEKAASLHKSTTRWSYLSHNYLALAQIEAAEDLSRREQTTEAHEAFQQAAKQLTKAEQAIRDLLGGIDSSEERRNSTELAETLDMRREYCLGRATLEEAKLLDRQGDHTMSSKKYGSATQRFQTVLDTMKDQPDRQAMQHLIYLSHAWQKMTKAEAEASPDLYSEASTLFDAAKKYSGDERTRVLALGHSRFCKALGAGMQYEDTGDMTLYSTAKKHLEAAAKHYLKAGFKTAAEYARATNRLFDSYMYMNKAETEANPTKKTQFYQMTEKLLQTSAGSYMKAQHPEKSEEVHRLLESVKEERQLAMSLSDVLHAPTTTTTTSSFATPTPTREQAVGLERFERADIQANLLVQVKEANVGEDLDLRMELVNAGKSPALLIKVDKVIPEGFEIREIPDTYTLQNHNLDLKGKRLNPLKTEDVKIVVRPQSKGICVIQPRILYIDETGKYKSHEPEPVTIIIKELGISGWIKGET